MDATEQKKLQTEIIKLLEQKNCTVRESKHIKGVQA